ncbi:hypothetical protein RHSIM_Rhsim11G0185500 [Rhododendron simsii]|uniref:Uncharacterized protein n=1 Tax=Rhododendron simsii TaxID=118357 RepID=A0A834G839_RHOSS|nr:hypothetical protein RHSIM_Rhsim11G0185500 [Rhododendron simsii]
MDTVAHFICNFHLLWIWVLSFLIQSRSVGSKLRVANKVVISSTAICRFPKGVPWVQYHGTYKELDISIVWPGKDTVLGGYWLPMYFLVFIEMIDNVLWQFP